MVMDAKYNVPVIMFILLASISIVLQHEMQELVLDLDFILSLNESFGMNHIEC